MDRTLNALARVALGLWIGGVATTTFVAMHAFRVIETREQAGDFMAPIFRAVDLFGVAAAIVATIAYRASRWRALLAAALGAAALINAVGLGPRIAQRVENWEFLHRVSEGVWTFILAGGILLLVVGSGPTKSGAKP